MSDRHFGPIRFICGENRGRYPFCHSLYVEEARVLIDPGASSDKLVRLRENEGVDMVWLSHWHEDHFTFLDLFAGRPLSLSERDMPPLTDIERLLDWYDIEQDNQRRFWRKAITDRFNYKPRQAARFLMDNEVIALGPATVEVIPTPGHTPGHLVFFFREEGLLFLGDYDLTSFGPWYGDLYSSIDDTVASLKKLKDIPARVWITGHDTGIFEENPGEHWERFVGVIYERENRLLDFLRTPRTLDEILTAWLMYGKPREPLAFFAFGERALVKKHLAHLEERRLITRDANGVIARL
jgi:hydroxyacylglutathione hydrolase